MLFAEIAAAYVADLWDRAARGVKRGKASTAAEFERLLKRLILPALGSRELEALDIAHVQALHRSLAATPAQANRCMTVISAVLGFAARHRRVRPAGGDPTAGIEPYAERKHRERFTLAQLAPHLEETSTTVVAHPIAAGPRGIIVSTTPTRAR